MAGISTARSERSPVPARRVRAIAVVAAFALIAIPATVFAAKGGGGSTTAPWIALASVSGQAVAAAEPRVGSVVRFATGYPTGTKNPWVSLTCYQDGALVYGEGGMPSSDFVLGGATSDWAATGGAATCRAELGDLYWRGGQQYYKYLAHTSFEAAA